MSVAFRSHKLTAQGNRQVRPCYKKRGGSENNRGGIGNSSFLNNLFKVGLHIHIYIYIYNIV